MTSLLSKNTGSLSLEETQMRQFQALIERLNSTMSALVGTAYGRYNPETNLAESVRDAIFELDSSKDYRESGYEHLSTSFSNRNQTGKLQRLEALEDELTALFDTLEAL